MKWKSLSCVWLFATPRTVVHGILQARILEWVAFPFSKESSQPRDQTQVSCMQADSLPAELSGNKHYPYSFTKVIRLGARDGGWVWRHCASSCISTWGTVTHAMLLFTAQLCLTLWDPMHCSPWNSPGQNTGVDSLSLLQGSFPTQGLNLGFSHCRWIIYQLSYKRIPPLLFFFF